MAEDNTNPQNKYEEFKGKFEDFVKYSQSAQKAYGGNKSPEIRDLAADLIPDGEDDVRKNYLKNYSRLETRELYNVLATASGQKKRNIKDYSDNNLEDILKHTPEQELAIGISIAEPKESYSGENAELYKEISELHKAYRKMAEVQNPEERKQKIVDFYENKYSGDENKDKLELVNALINSGGNFAEVVYEYQMSEKQAEVSKKLKGYEAGYLAANLESKDFLEFYMNLEGVKEQMEKESGRGRRPRRG